jgi:hypothetical protein
MHCRKGRRNKFAETGRHLSETKGCAWRGWWIKNELFTTLPPTDRSTARPSGPRKTPHVRTHFRLKLPRPHSSRLVRSLCCYCYRRESRAEDESASECAAQKSAKKIKESPAGWEFLLFQAVLPWPTFLTYECIIIISACRRFLFASK